MTPLRRRGLDYMRARRAVARMGNPPALVALLDAERWSILEAAARQWEHERTARGAPTP